MSPNGTEVKDITLSTFWIILSISDDQILDFDSLTNRLEIVDVSVTCQGLFEQKIRSLTNYSRFSSKVVSILSVMRKTFFHLNSWVNIT